MSGTAMSLTKMTKTLIFRIGENLLAAFAFRTVKYIQRRQQCQHVEELLDQCFTILYDFPNKHYNLSDEKNGF